MQTKLLARPYAEALYNTICEQKQVQEQILQEYQALVDFASKDELFQIFLETPSVSQATKEAFLHKALHGKCHELLLNFFEVLARKGRLFLFQEIYQQIEELLELQGEKVRVHITTAIPLTDENRTSIIAIANEIEHDGDLRRTCGCEDYWWFCGAD